MKLYDSLKISTFDSKLAKIKRRERRLHNLIKFTKNDKALVLHQISRKNYLHYPSEDILSSED